MISDNRDIKHLTKYSCRGRRDRDLYLALNHHVPTQLSLDSSQQSLTSCLFAVEYEREGHCGDGTRRAGR